MKKHLLKAPEHHISDAIKSTIAEWDEIPTALQILKSLDYSVHTAGASTFVIKTLEVLLDRAINEEKTTYETVVSYATWRT
jgi:hypothetical protein